MTSIFLTGVTSGIGAIVLRECIRDGRRVLVLVRSEEQGRALRQEHGDQVESLVADLRFPAQTSALSETLRTRRFDQVLLNAGYAVLGPFADVSADDFDAMIEANLLANTRLVRALLPGLRESKGKLTIVSSIVARLPGRDYAAYGVAKAGLSHFAQSLRLEEPELKLLCLEIGGVNSEFHQKSRSSFRVEKFKSTRTIGRRVYRAMFSGSTGLRTLDPGWWLMRRIAMAWQDQIVGLVRMFARPKT